MKIRLNRLFETMVSGRAVRSRPAEAGITVQDALFNGVITLVILAVLVAVFFVVKNQFGQTNAQSEVAAIVNGIRQANGGNTDYSGVSFTNVKAANLLPPTVAASGAQATASWTTNPIVVAANGTAGFSLEINTGTDVGTCEAVLNGEVHDAADVGTAAGVGTYAANGAYAGGTYTSAATVCGHSTDLFYTFQ